MTNAHDCTAPANPPPSEIRGDEAPDDRPHGRRQTHHCAPDSKSADSFVRLKTVTDHSHCGAELKRGAHSLERPRSIERR